MELTQRFIEPRVIEHHERETTTRSGRLLVGPRLSSVGPSVIAREFPALKAAVDVVRGDDTAVLYHLRCLARWQTSEEVQSRDLGCQPPRILRPSAVGAEEGDVAEEIDLSQGRVMGDEVVVDADENVEFGQRAGSRGWMRRQPGRAAKRKIVVDSSEEDSAESEGEESDVEIGGDARRKRRRRGQPQGRPVSVNSDFGQRGGARRQPGRAAKRKMPVINSNDAEEMGTSSGEENSGGSEDQESNLESDARPSGSAGGEASKG